MHLKTKKIIQKKLQLNLGHASLTLTFYLFIILLISCKEIDCNRLPKNYLNYNEAVKLIKQAHFKVKESINTTNSSWIREATYYTCDGVTGFLILKTDKQYYLYSGIPLEIWLGFKNAKSFGGYYNQNIRHKFYFNLN